MTQILTDSEAQAYSTGMACGRASEREQIATLVENLQMQDLLLAMGEMSEQERKTCRALVGLIALRIRGRKS